MVMAFVAAAIAMLVALIPAGIVLYRGELVASVVAYEFITSVAVMVLALLAQVSSARPCSSCRWCWRCSCSPAG